MAAQLGFLEPLEWNEDVQKDFSISRLGGLPTWPIGKLPTVDELSCQTCKRPLRLLIQLYAPIEDENILRILYVFMCKDGRCQKPAFSPAFKILRIQLPWSAISPPPTCSICNFPPLPTGFCSSAHADRHARSLQSTRIRTNKNPPQDIAWIPHEIVSEEEPEEDLDLDLDLGRQRVEDDDSTVGEGYEKPVGDRTFQKFARRVERAPEQILRYVRIPNSEPPVLHCSKDGVLLEQEFPKCRGCGAGTGVEFQIMPGLLALMDSDVGGKEELDWGVLNVLTCKANCKTEGYVGEFLWRQEVSLEGLKSEVL